MKKITKNILEYRILLMELWNRNFTVIENERDPFNYEIDKAFGKIEEGLF
ncbi:MAG: hypothetical protein ACI81T_002952 [Bacteroidia bacterium]|jgi:hypothetical protein